MRSQDYEKTKTAIRYWLLGRKYYTALAAMEFGLKHHTGMRKDGVMPEFQHQVSQANYTRTIADSLMYPEETIAVNFLHDVVEDCSVNLDDINKMLDLVNTDFEMKYRILNSVDLMTNQYADGTKKATDVYYEAMIDCPISSIAKGCDRIHNHQTMGGAFTIEKQNSYINETQFFIIPMLKNARKQWIQQEPAYQNIKHILMTQIELVDQIIERAQATNANV